MGRALEGVARVMLQPIFARQCHDSHFGCGPARQPFFVLKTVLTRQWHDPRFRCRPALQHVLVLETVLARLLHTLDL